MKNLTFNKFVQLRKNFLQANNKFDHVVLKGKNNVLISAPHGVPQLRLGKLKIAEIGALAIALWVNRNTDSFLIAKTKCNNDDANFDKESSYKDEMKRLIRLHNIKYVLDFHGLAQRRECDINLGVHLGDNIKVNTKVFDTLNKKLKEGGFKVSIDQPFMAGAGTISGSMKKEFEDIWTLQIEINCGISNMKENFVKNQKLINIISEWINLLK